MTWFKVDDKFHSHPKVIATEPAALGLWVVAGSWVSANLTDGFVPDTALVRLLPGASKLAKKLVAAGLWERSDTGYRFHDWHQANPTAEHENARKADQARRQAAFRERQKQARNASRNALRNASSNGETNASPTRPPLKGEGGGAAQSAGAAPPPTRTLTSGRVVCATHQTEITEGGTCRGCASDLIAAGDTDDLDQRPPSREELRAQLAGARSKYATSPRTARLAAAADRSDPNGIST